MTMSLVSTVTVGAGGAASIDFTSIPQTGTDLLVVSSVRSDSATITRVLYLNVNGSTTSYSDKTLNGTGTTVSSTTNIGGSIGVYGGAIPAATAVANTFNNTSFYIPNYAGSANKTISADATQENNISAAQMNLVASLWSNTAAITSISLTTSGNFVQYSTASLYTITKGSGGASVS